MAQGRDVVRSRSPTLSQFTLAFDPTNLHAKCARIGSRSCLTALFLSGSLRLRADEGIRLPAPIEIEILKLRDEAKEKLGPRFDIKAFHDAVLENGGCRYRFYDSRLRPTLRRLQQHPDTTGRIGYH
jgi:hypothetical protein